MRITKVKKSVIRNVEIVSNVEFPMTALFDDYLLGVIIKFIQKERRKIGAKLTMIASKMVGKEDWAREFADLLKTVFQGIWLDIVEYRRKHANEFAKAKIKKAKEKAKEIERKARERAKRR